MEVIFSFICPSAGTNVIKYGILCHFVLYLKEKGFVGVGE